jgi:CBS domain-containing protein
MTPNPTIVHPKDSVAFALKRMEEGGYRHLPVVDEAGQPVGVLSVKRIVHYLVEHFPATVYNLPPDPGAVPLEPEGA